MIPLAILFSGAIYLVTGDLVLSVIIGGTAAAVFTGIVRSGQAAARRPNYARLRREERERREHELALERIRHQPPPPPPPEPTKLEKLDALKTEYEEDVQIIPRLGLSDEESQELLRRAREKFERRVGELFRV